jgi:hypothetical protein
MWWQGKSGMTWGELIPRISHLLKFEQPPEILVIHCGANSIGHIKLSINNSRFAEFLPLIYPPELEVKETTDTASSASFWTYTSNLTTVVNSVLKFMISGTTSILKS